MRREFKEREELLLPFLAFIAILPLIVHGCSCGHDFDFHLLSWMEVATQFAHGNLHPHWAYTPAFNAGEPRFIFYPPFSWYLGAGVGLVLKHLPKISEASAWTGAPILFTWLCLSAAGVSFYRLARAFVSPNAALLAATLYLANPYMLFTAYERTAYAELLAAAWIPLLFLGILRARVTIAGIAVPLALLWLTNAPAAVMGSYSLGVLAALRIALNPGHFFTTRDRNDTIRGSLKHHSVTTRVTMRIIAGTMLGLALAAFYIVPAAAERRLVHIAMAIIPGLRIQDNFLFHHTTGPDAVLHDIVLHTASMVAVTLLAGTAIALALNRVRKTSGDPVDTEKKGSGVPVFALTVMATGIAFLLTPWSALIWRYAPQAAFLQFPWRLLAILACVFALAAAGSVDRLRLTAVWSGLVSVVLVAALAAPAYYVFAQRCYVEDTPAARLALFHSTAGTDPTDEYTPMGADNDPLRQGNPPYWLADSPQAPPPAGATPGVAPSELRVGEGHPRYAILDLRDDPHWRAFDPATGPLPFGPARPDGLITVVLGDGPETVEVRYVTGSDQVVGDAISVVAGVVLVRVMLARRRRGQRAARSRV